MYKALTLSENKIVIDAVDLANKVLLSPSFYDIISNKPGGFDQRYTGVKATPAWVSTKLKTGKDKLKVIAYYKRFSRANAYTLKGKEDTLYLNTAKLSRSLPSIAASIIHEIVHLAETRAKNEYLSVAGQTSNDFDFSYRFNHGDNSPVGKQETAPYWIDDLAERIAHDILGTTAPQMPRRKHIPWYRRFFNWIF